MKRIISLLAAAVLCVTAAMATVVVVDGVHVRLRFSPSTSGKVLTDAGNKPVYPAKGDTFKYLGTEGSFYKIDYYNNVMYISRDYCHLKEEKSTQKATTTTKTKVVVVDGTNVRLRRAPSTRGEIALNEEGQTMYPKKGSSFTYLGTEGNFYKIDYYGEELYISRDYTHLKTK